MKYYRKSCILRQLKEGFSGDGKPLTGLIKVEKYGQNVAAEVSIINFAPLSHGEYYCLLSDGFGKVEKLPLRGKCYFNFLSDFNLEKGFCGVVCFVYEDVVPIACGIGGEEKYDFPSILAAAFPSQKRKKQTAPPPIQTENEAPRVEFSTNEESSEEPAFTPESAVTSPYDDEKITDDNYFEKEEENESNLSKKSGENVRPQSGSQDEKTQGGTDLPQNADDEIVRQSFKVDGQGYYDGVQAELDALFAAHPRDDTLKGAFSSSEWVRVKGEEDAPQYLVGVVYEDLTPKYICYAIASDSPSSPPEELGDACTFVPTSPFDENKGFFVIFQSAATGECLRPKQC